MTTATAKADLSRSALLRRLDERLFGLEMERLTEEITLEDYRAMKANLLRQVRAIEALAD